jgi:aspartate/methionine/tyrosine aminotransferase
MVVPEDTVRGVERLAQNMFICPSHAGQRLALHAMDCGEALAANVRVYAENRRLMLEALPAMGFERIAPPDGAFYIYADVSRWTDDARGFCAEILDEARVAVTPGLDFDPEEGHRWVRFSYARSTADIREGIARLGAFMVRRAERKAGE